MKRFSVSLAIVIAALVGCAAFVALPSNYRIERSREP